MRLLSILRILLVAVSVSAAQAEQPSARKVWADANTNLLGGLSPDGKLLSFAEAGSGDLAVYELATGRTRALTSNPTGAETFAYFSVFSRDGKSLAYAWFNEEGFYELWTVDLEGGEPRRLYRNAESGFVQPCDWSPDGSQVLTLFFRKDNVSQIALVSTADGSVRVLKTLSWFYPKRISFSPDGRFILYDSVVGRSEAARDVLLLNADASSERTLIEHPANDLFPQWTPSGDGVIFASDRSGEMDLWLAPVREGELAGEAVRVARSFGRALPLGVTPGGIYYYGLRAGRSDVLTAGVAAGGAGEGITAGIRTIGRNTAPVWSRGGERVAFLTELGTENYGRQSRGVTIWTPSSRQETLLVPSLAFISRLRWSPGDTRVLASGSDGVGRSGLYTVDPDTGAVEGLVRIHDGEPEGLEGEWLNDQDIAYITSDYGAIRRSTTGNRAEEIIFQAPPGTKVRRLAADHAGTWIAFGLGAAEAPQEAWALHVEDGLRHRLMTVREGIVSAMSWSGDAVYVTTRGPTGAAVWRVSLGSEPVRTSLPAGDDEPSFSPDGRHVAYVEDDRRSEVWALEGWLPNEAATTTPRAEGAPKMPPSGP